ncbi:tripartite tricarboxylate transporter substrate binding protein [Verminephrobacter aporrectodeae subsp. tuberculatae]|uniref:Bug family tripartite tricarboxylate transporter substrate binding protein n=1 Tax=Verminephrobacter aporrectodeae TaxID=1110389 RepID=UPI0022379788|nr:tripartite tricarboxylate transporter substrate binding protein [Verminephrobacter aporrectodeae]MCW5223132.1 tripartite tricarboxylate transporter substrate binding protein [Verminephrobacter aporrectodeae subsp. tuberculatae]MCW5256650.1 tripartite tricarboxylate transporter substrate binding protein [Verminephrobacter aporrectodeae subsp. tuberculatae]MCW5288596.1 tripartite tricarboxylate transporter substrate binding protein [Verminephrobacter aporrectodeae subsp. tuberculatae]MCW819938
MNRRHWLDAALCVVGTAGLAPFAARAGSSAWPSRPIRLIVPFPAGGGADLVARHLAQGLGEQLGAPVIVDNRTGAAGNIGTDAVAKAAPDGYTIGLVTSGPMVNNKFLYKAMPFDPDKDLAPIASVCEIPMVLASNPQQLPLRDLREFIDVARTRPSAFVVATPGNGTIGHLALAALSLTAGVRLQDLPYRGDAPALTDLLGGVVQAACAPVSAFIPQIQAGRLRGLAVTSQARFPGLPDVPTAQEQGVDLTATVWLAVVGPAGMPAPLVQRLNAQINRLLDSVSGRSSLQQHGAVVAGGSPESLRQRIHADSQKWQQVIKAAHIRID